MKHSFVSLITMLWLLLGSCHNDDKVPNSSVERVRSTMNDGTWYITYFVDSDTEETANFEDYTFDFFGDNTVTATKSQTVNTGTWSVKQKDGDSDDLDNLEFNIYFSTPVEFQDLTDDWEIISRSETKLELRHASGGSGGVDFLTFEKAGS